MKLADMGLRSGPNPPPRTTAWTRTNLVTLHFRSSPGAQQDVASSTKCLLAELKRAPSATVRCRSLMANENKVNFQINSWTEFIKSIRV